MLLRVSLLLVTCVMLMSATCKKLDCAATGMDKCDFNMKEIVKSPDGKYTAITGKRICNGRQALQEVAVYAKGESLNNKCGNAYATTDTLAPLHVQWKANTLQVFTPGYKSDKTIVRETKLYKTIKVEYANSSLLIIPEEENN